jgi:sortase A
VIAEFGITLITLGVVILLFAGYQLWGTGIAEARSQRRLKHDFAAAVPTTTSTAVSTSSSTALTTTTASGPSPVLPAAGALIAEGQAAGLLEIPKISVNVAFVQGVNDNDLRLGPGHYPGTPYPGESGNASIAGHRTTYGAPFYRLNELKVGDQILATTRAGKFEYVVSGSIVVSPSHSEVLNATPDNRLTLTTCNPRYSASQRLIVVASLKGLAAPAQPQVVPSQAAAPGIAKTDAPVIATPALSGDHGAWPTTIVWGLVLVALWVATRVVARRWRRLPSFGVGVPVCLAAMWMVFVNVARLLPGNI